jgi:SAM-dependent methyltransferase
MKHGGIVHRSTMILPYGVKTVLGYRYKKYMYFSYLRRTFGARFSPGDPGPIAPPELIETEALMRADDLNIRKRPEWYFGSGYREAWTVLTTVEQYGAPIKAMKSVLEFGCGSGRVIRHFRYIDGLRLAGTDANSKPVEWDSRNLPGIEFSHNALEPPLAYPDGSLDFVYALSVFTHIPLEWQRPWLEELRRVLPPGGYLLCTVHGEHDTSTQLNDQDRAALKRDGKVTLDAKNPRASYSSQVLGSSSRRATRYAKPSARASNFSATPRTWRRPARIRWSYASRLASHDSRATSC